jgi:hypothetical protein
VAIGFLAIGCGTVCNLAGGFVHPDEEPKDLPARYAAWLTPAAGQGDVQLIDLGETDRIDAAVKALREELRRCQDPRKEVNPVLRLGSRLICPMESMQAKMHPGSWIPVVLNLHNPFASRLPAPRSLGRGTAPTKEGHDDRALRRTLGAAG